MIGCELEIKTLDGVAKAYVTRPAGTTALRGAVMFIDALGYRPTMHAIADRVAATGYVVVVPNIFYREGDYAPFDPKTVFAGGAELQRLMKLVTGYDDRAAMRDAATWLDFLDRRDDVRERAHGAFGYCMGGGLALQTACAYPDRVAAVASFHGGRFLTTADGAQQLATRCKAATYVGVAQIDRNHDQAVTDRLEAAFTTAGVPHAIERYPDASHGWCVPDHPAYQAEGAERHYGKLGELFAKHLR